MGDDSDAQLEQRVDQLEQQLSKMLPGRRGVLKGLGAAALGGAAVGGATGGASGQASSDTSVGAVGAAGDDVDVYLDQLRDPGGDEVLNVDDTGAINAQPREWVFDSVSTEKANYNGHAVISRTVGDIVNTSGRRFKPGDYDDFGTAVNAAITDQDTPGAVYLPSGVHEYTTPIDNPKDGVSVLGAGKRDSVLYYLGDDYAMGLDGGGSRSNFGHMTLKGNGRSNNSAVGFKIDSTDGTINHASFGDMYIHGFGSHGIYETAANGNSMWQNSYEDIIFEDIGGDAFNSSNSASEGGSAEKTLYRLRSYAEPIEGDFIFDTQAGLFNSYIHCAAEPNVMGRGYDIRGDSLANVYRCKAEGCGGSGLYMRDQSGLSIEAYWALNNGDHGLHAFGDYTDCWFNQINSSDNTNYQMLLEGNGTVKGNVVGIVPNGYSTTSSTVIQADVYNNIFKSNSGIELPDGARIYVDSNGDIIAEDSQGNTNTLV